MGQAMPEEEAAAVEAPENVGESVVYDDGSYLWTDLGGVCGTWACCGLYGGLEGTFLAPVGEPNQTVVLTDLKKGRMFDGSTAPGLGAGVRTWVGLNHCGYGFRVGYWYMGNHHICPHPVVPDKAPAFDEAYYLDVSVLDIELTQQICCGHLKIDSSLGGRYARLERNSTVVGYGTAGGVDMLGLAMGAHEMEGSGFTFSIGARAPLHFLCGLNLYCRYRGSLLWADTSASVLTQAQVVSAKPQGFANSLDRAYACSDDDERLYISELQAGVQYERCIPCCPAKLFVRAGMEYQHWDTGNLVAESASFAFLQGFPPLVGGRVDAAASANDGKLDMIGFVLAAGVTY
jgi:hypothetical protein